MQHLVFVGERKELLIKEGKELSGDAGDWDWMVIRYHAYEEMGTG